MTLRTRLTEFFGIESPILLAPMAEVSGGPAGRGRDGGRRLGPDRRRLR